MRILIENSGYELRNMGDVAMLQVAVSRLQGAFPDAQLQVLTKDPERLEFYCPGTVPVNAWGRNALLEARLLPGALPARLARLTSWPERGARRAFLGRQRRRAAILAARQSEVGSARSYAQNRGVVDAFWKALCGADVFVGTGGGYLTEAFEGHALNVCDALIFAARRGQVTALMGQGVGPIQGKLLRTAARQALERVDLLGLRERVLSQPLCLELGAAPDRLCVTGDDAIELCLQLAAPDAQTGAPDPRAALGVNVRVSGYSGVTPTQLLRLRHTLGQLAGELGAPLLGTPISTYQSESDSDSIARLLEGEDALLEAGHAVSSPAEAIAQIGRCRVVVTGSYHAGVFALSQGIPVVALVASLYYVGKFNGLAAQFEGGCHIVTLDAPAWETQLAQAVRDFWPRDAAREAALRRAAHQQVQSGLAAYDRLFALIEARAQSKSQAQTQPLPQATGGAS